MPCAACTPASCRSSSPRLVRPSTVQRRSRHPLDRHRAAGCSCSCSRDFHFCRPVAAWCSIASPASAWSPACASACPRAVPSYWRSCAPSPPPERSAPPAVWPTGSRRSPWTRPTSTPSAARAGLAPGPLPSRGGTSHARDRQRPAPPGRPRAVALAGGSAAAAHRARSGGLRSRHRAQLAHADGPALGQRPAAPAPGRGPRPALGRRRPARRTGGAVRAAARAHRPPGDAARLGPRRSAPRPPSPSNSTAAIPAPRCSPPLGC